jgi:folate-binding protein YgfZ
MPGKCEVNKPGRVAEKCAAGQVVAMPLRLDRAFLRVSGPDAIVFLDNLLTQDVTKLNDASVLYSALLTPQGKVVADMFLWAENDKPAPSVLIECDPSRSAELLRRLNLYRLRARVAIEDATAQAIALYSDQNLGGNKQDPRNRALGWRDVTDLQALFEDDAGTYEHHRLALGVPDLARDAAPEEVFAGEALLEELNGVAFDKGCFVGQENVSRMKRRATTRKKFCPIVFEGEAIAYGTPVLAGEAEIGSVRTGAAGRAMALVRLDRALDAMSEGKPLTAAGRAVRLDPPPWLILPPRAGEPD